MAMQAYEGFILDKAMERYPFAHWGAHLVSFWGRFSDDPVYHGADDAFPNLQAAIAIGLRTVGRDRYADDVLATSSETELNRLLIRQYTDDLGFYAELNLLLRSAHNGAQLGEHVLAPWILQFNCALRLQPRHHEPVYRGVTLSDFDIQQYRQNEFFIWSPFVSASKDPDECLGGNVLFELRPWGAIDEYEKRDPRDVTGLSVFPEEQEVIFPMCCAYRPVAFHRSPRRTEIVLEVVDCA
jgi:hypothetical protein